MSTCEQPFWMDPKGFVTNFNIRYEPQCDGQVFNFIARIMILGIVVGSLGSILCGPISFAVCILLAAIIAVIIIATAPKPQPPNVGEMEIELTPTFTYKGTGTDVTVDPNYNEGFTAYSPPVISRLFGVEARLPYNDASPYTGPSLPEYTPPTAKNLFMNVLLEEYKYNPDRPAAAPVSDPIVKQTFDDYFRVQWFSDPTDVFGKSQSQRQFVTQPSTSIPNDQKSFQDWLYKIPGKTCKEGGAYCTTQGSAGTGVPWMGE